MTLKIKNVKIIYAPYDRAVGRYLVTFSNNSSARVYGEWDESAFEITTQETGKKLDKDMIVEIEQEISDNYSEPLDEK